MAALQAAVAAHPSSATLSARLGFAHAAVDHVEPAIVALRRATRLDPTLAQAQRILGMLYLRSGKHAEAARALEAASAKLRATADDWPQIAGCHAALEAWDLAAKAAAKGLALDAQHAALHRFLGDALVHVGNLAEAAPHLEAALHASPDDQPIRLALGRAYMATNRHAEAASTLRDLVSATPGDAIAWRELGRAHDALGEPGQAADAYKELTRLLPRDADASNT